MSNHAYFSQKHVKAGGGIFRWKNKAGQMVDCTAVSPKSPWSSYAYFDDAEYLGEVEHFVRKVQDSSAVKAAKAKGRLG